jgi:hypothetical protein
LVRAVVAVAAGEGRQVEQVRTADLPTTVPDVTTTVTVPPTTVPNTTIPDTTVPPTVPEQIATVTGTSGTLQLKAVIRPASTLAGHFVHFQIDASDSSGGVFALGADYGDGSPTGMPAPPDVLCVKPDGPTTTRPSSNTWSFDHAYRRPGVYKVVIMVAVGNCGREGNTVEVRSQVVVAPGSVLSNGPQAPEVRVGQSANEDRDPALTIVSFGLIDLDGYVKKLTFDWGDSSPLVVVDFPLSSCADPVTRWPKTSKDYGLEHRYASSGQHVVKATIVSSGCDGLAEQTASAEATVEAP